MKKKTEQPKKTGPEAYVQFLREGETLNTVDITVLRKRKSDEKKRVQGQKFSVREWEDYFADHFARELESVEKATRDFRNTVAKELGLKDWIDLPESAAEATYHLGWISETFKRNLFKRCDEGEICAGGHVFADVAGKQIVHAAHEHSLTSSPTFKEKHFETLRLLDQRYGKPLSGDPVERASQIAVKEELAGKYVFVPQPKPEEPVATPTPALQASDILVPEVKPQQINVRAAFDTINESLDRAASRLLSPATEGMK